MNYLQRYEAGEYRVWDELVESASEMSSNPELKAQTVAVAEALMTRVRTNVNTLRNTLITAGASLAEPGKPLEPTEFAFLTERFGPLPLALDVFYRTIGSISFAPAEDYDYGTVTLEQTDGVSLIALDPLIVEPASIFDFLVEEFDDNDADEPFELYLCADFLHKQNISGGMPYSIQLPPNSPQDTVDPSVLWERNDLSFVSYLRYCFKWGGFPGLDVCESDDDSAIDLNWRIGFEEVRGPWRPAYQRLVGALREDLIEF